MYVAAQFRRIRILEYAHASQTHARSLLFIDEIVRLLGQGTFGKVVEAIDLKRGSKVAIKVIRSVPKYRDASRIELRVLSTLASNDETNANRCIHLRDCFDFKNHICIVTDLFGQSVFDFLKSNGFVPFPSSHIQKFAKQLFTSVACMSLCLLLVVVEANISSSSRFETDPHGPEA